MSSDPEVDVDDEREEGELYAVFRKEWLELQDHEENPIITCENPMEVEP